MGTAEGVSFLRDDAGPCSCPSVLSVPWPSEAVEDVKLLSNVRLIASGELGIPGYGDSHHGLWKVVETSVLIVFPIPFGTSSPAIAQSG